MDNDEFTHKFNEISDSKRYGVCCKIFLDSIIILLINVVLMLYLHLYTCWCLLCARRRPFLYEDENYLVVHEDSDNPNVPLETIPSSGLDTSLISSLPDFSYNPDTHPENPLHCAICLSKFQEGEIGRVLPKFNHMFHIGCIDMWFYSHTTCPLCRYPLEPRPEGDNRPADFCESSFGASSGLEENQDDREVSLLRRQPSPLVDATIDVPIRNDDFCDEMSSIHDSLSSSSFQSPMSGVLSFRSIIIEEHKGSDSPLSGDDCFSSAIEINIECDGKIRPKVLDWS